MELLEPGWSDDEVTDPSYIKLPSNGGDNLSSPNYSYIYPEGRAAQNLHEQSQK